MIFSKNICFTKIPFLLRSWSISAKSEMDEKFRFVKYKGGNRRVSIKHWRFEFILTPNFHCSLRNLCGTSKMAVLTYTNCSSLHSQSYKNLVTAEVVSHTTLVQCFFVEDVLSFWSKGYTQKFPCCLIPPKENNLKIRLR